MQFDAAKHLHSPGGGRRKLIGGPLELNAKTGGKYNSNVAALQQLLAAAGQTVNIDGRCGDRINKRSKPSRSPRDFPVKSGSTRMTIIY